MSTHLIAGGAGFIGSHLADALVARGDRVVIIDNFVSGRAINIEHLANHERVKVFELDVASPSAVASISEAVGGPIDSVLNLASPASPNDFLTIPLRILEAGSAGTRNLLEVARDKGARFLFASTSEVYGDPLVHPQPESYLGNVSSTGPRSCYDEAKRYGEALTMAFHRVHGVDARIVRIFNTYGERMKPTDGRVVNSFIRSALRGDPLTLHGGGEQTRSFCYVSDEIKGILAVLGGDQVGPVNIGNPAEITVRELAETVIRLTNSESKLISCPHPPERYGDPLQRCPDITVARESYGWEPSIDLESGLRRMISWFTCHEDLDA